LKHFLGSFATPFMMALLLGAAQLICRRARQAARRGVAPCSALAILYMGSLLGVGEALLAPLESQYPPLRADAQLQNISAIVVLGSGYTPRDSIPGDRRARCGRPGARR
jgi:uncharacterized SAM-binding protein YcdF (DUF218 family)